MTLIFKRIRKDQRQIVTLDWPNDSISSTVLNELSKLIFSECDTETLRHFLLKNGYYE